MSFEIHLGKRPPLTAAWGDSIFARALAPLESAVDITGDIRSRQELEGLIESLEGAGTALWPKHPVASIRAAQERQAGR